MTKSVSFMSNDDVQEALNVISDQARILGEAGIKQALLSMIDFSKLSELEKAVIARALILKFIEKPKDDEAFYVEASTSLDKLIPRNIPGGFTIHYAERVNNELHVYHSPSDKPDVANKVIVAKFNKELEMCKLATPAPPMQRKELADRLWVKIKELDPEYIPPEVYE